MTARIIDLAAARAARDARIRSEAPAPTEFRLMSVVDGKLFHRFEAVSFDAAAAIAVAKGWRVDDWLIHPTGMKVIVVAPPA